MKTLTIELTESEAWVLSTALFEYHKNPISDIHGDVSLGLYRRIKDIILDGCIAEAKGQGSCYIGDEDRSDEEFLNTEGENDRRQSFTR